MCEDHTTEADQDTTTKNTGYQLPFQTSLSQFQIPSYGRSPSSVPAIETNLLSSESASSLPIPTSLLSNFATRSSPPTDQALAYTDRAENCTNTMMYALLSTLSMMSFQRP